MSLIPTWPFVVGALIAGTVGGGSAVHTYMAAKIDRMKLENAEEISKASNQALIDYKAGADVIKAAAATAQTDLTAINAQLATIRREQKNAPPPPLPVDCKPGAIRLHNLSETAAAADRAIARPVPSK